MFVKVIYETGRESLYECDEVYIDHLESKDSNDPGSLYLTLTRDLKDKHVEVAKDKNEVYLMNNDGKTIDKYAW